MGSNYTQVVKPGILPSTAAMLPEFTAMLAALDSNRGSSAVPNFPPVPMNNNFGGSIHGGYYASNCCGGSYLFDGCNQMNSADYREDRNYWFADANSTDDCWKQANKTEMLNGGIFNYIGNWMKLGTVALQGVTGVFTSLFAGLGSLGAGASGSGNGLLSGLSGLFGGGSGS